MTDFRILLPDELEAIARRVAREPLYSSDGDCRTAFADRRHLLGHIIATTATDVGRALGASRAQAIVAERQDWAAEAPDDSPPPPASGL